MKTRVVSLLGMLVFLMQTVSAQNTLVMGSLKSGQTVSFIKNAKGNWGISVADKSVVVASQSNPATLTIRNANAELQKLESGYQSVVKKGNTVVATAKMPFNVASTFEVQDNWSIADNVLKLQRSVTVKGSTNEAGFYSSVALQTTNQKRWNQTQFLIPGLVYGKPYTRANLINGSNQLSAGFFSIREDYLSAPLFGLYFVDNSWISLLDLSPNGATTLEETLASSSTPIVDSRILFGSLGARALGGGVTGSATSTPSAATPTVTTPSAASPAAATGGVELAFSFPGTTNELGGSAGMRSTAPGTPVVRYRCHPVKDGFVQHYSLGFCFGKSADFAAMERETWRWAWQQLAPKATTVNVEEMRKALVDQLAGQVITVEDRAGIPFVIDAVTGNPGSYRPKLRLYNFGGNNAGTVSPETQELADWAKSIGVKMDVNAAELNLWPMIVMGFCGKHIEVGEQLLMEADRDQTERGQKLKTLGYKVLDALVKYVPMSPYPSGEAYNLRTGKPGSARTPGAFGLRPLAEDMRIMMDILLRERAKGRKHLAWLNWSKACADWLMTQQRADGSFPMNWINGAATDTSGACTYAAVPFLAKMSQVTGDSKYLVQAIRAGHYVWNSTGKACYYLGATGTSSVVDKESGMLSLEAFLTLYERTGDKIWLDRAKSAGDYTESWIWIWNVPMPEGANAADLGWKPGVPTIGVNGIGSNDIGGVDQYLDWAVPSYAKLYKFTGDKHYLDVAFILLHGTKAMLALPGRTYDLLAPGWQQEHWKMGPVRGIGAHRTWLPWITINHLHGITGLDEFDPELYRQLSQKLPF